MKRSVLGIFFILILLVSVGGICKSRYKAPDNVNLTYWTVYNDTEVLNTAIEQFTATYPYINVEVRQMNGVDYEEKLLDAWARGEGPDIFSIPNYKLGSMKDLIEPMPVVVNLTAVTVEENFGSKETVATQQAIRTLTPRQLSNSFPQVVYDDVVMSHRANEDSQPSDKLFGIPYSMDTLVLFYNKDMMNRAKIALPPTSWDQFVEQVPKLTLVDIDNNIIQSGTALGTSENISGVMDIISLLMMQNGATMVDGSRATFAYENDEQKGYFPGVKAVEFYTSFSDPDVEWYSWNEEKADALEAFISGEVAFFFGYHYNLEDIQSRAPNLNFDIAPVPQVDHSAEITYANYWLETVSVNTEYPEEAWGLLQGIATDDNIMTTYLDTTKRPAALKSLLTGQEEDYVLSIFADQSLTAQSWYAGNDPDETEKLFKEMVDLINQDKLDTNTVVSNTADKVSLTYEN